MKKLIILIALFSCSENEPVVPKPNNDGLWHTNYYDLTFRVKGKILNTVQYTEPIGGDYSFDHVFIGDSLRFTIDYTPEHDLYTTSTTMTFGWKYAAEAHLGWVKGTITYEDGSVVQLYQNKQSATVFKID